MLKLYFTGNSSDWFFFLLWKFFLQNKKVFFAHDQNFNGDGSVFTSFGEKCSGFFHNRTQTETLFPLTFRLKLTGSQVRKYLVSLFDCFCSPKTGLFLIQSAGSNGSEPAGFCEHFRDHGALKTIKKNLKISPKALEWASVYSSRDFLSVLVEEKVLNTWPTWWIWISTFRASCKVCSSIMDPVSLPADWSAWTYTDTVTILGLPVWCWQLSVKLKQEPVGPAEPLHRYSGPRSITSRNFSCTTTQNKDLVSV